MKWLSRLLRGAVDAVPPLPPAGGMPFVSYDHIAGELKPLTPAMLTIRYALPGEDHTPVRPRVAGTPSFTGLAEADRYLQCMIDRTPYRYPSGAV